MNKRNKFKNVKIITFILFVLVFLDILFLELGIVLEDRINSVALSIIYSIVAITTLFLLFSFFIFLFMLNKKEKNEKENLENKYILTHKNNIVTLLKSVKDANQDLHISNATSVYAYLECLGKYNIEVYLNNKRFFIAFYETYVEYFLVDLENFYPDEKDMIQKSIRQDMDLKEIESFINETLEELL